MRPSARAELLHADPPAVHRLPQAKHRLVARNRILRLEDRKDGRIDIVCLAELEVIVPVPKRAHQGWRYLEESDAPTNTDDGTGLGELPPRLYGKLAALALV